MTEAPSTKKFRAFCTEHAGGLWYGPCRDKRDAAAKDGNAHESKTGHKDHDVESDVDPAECQDDRQAEMDTKQLAK